MSTSNSSSISQWSSTTQPSPTIGPQHRSELVKLARTAEESFFHPHTWIAEAVWVHNYKNDPSTEPPADWDCEGMFDCSHKDSEHAPAKCCPGHCPPPRSNTLFEAPAVVPNTTDAVLLKDKCNVWVVIQKYTKGVPAQLKVALEAMKSLNCGGKRRKCTWHNSPHEAMVIAAVGKNIDHILEITDGCVNLHGDSTARLALAEGARALSRAITAEAKMWEKFMDTCVPESGYQRPNKGIYEPFSVDPASDLDAQASANADVPIGWTTRLSVRPGHQRNELKGFQITIESIRCTVVCRIWGKWNRVMWMLNDL